MDTRRFLIAGTVCLLQAGCAHSPAAVPREPLASTPESSPAGDSEASGLAVEAPLGQVAHSSAHRQDDPVDRQTTSLPALPATARAYLEVVATAPARGASGPHTAAEQGPGERRRALGVANSAARSVSSDDRFDGGIRVFAWSPGRVYEIWTAPLRITTLTLSPGEVLLAKAAGDTVRWQIADATSGEGLEARTHVMLKPLQRDLATNLILTTNRRVYLIELRSGGSDAFNTAVTWEPPAFQAVPSIRPADPESLPPLIDQDAVIDARYRIEPEGARPPWTPTSVFNDGRRTFMIFPREMQFDEAPALFVIGREGDRQMVNYRQVGGLFIVDRVLERAELRLGDRRPRIVRVFRTGSRP